MSRPGLLLAICYVGFVSLGLPDTLLGVAWPSIRTTFGLRQEAIGALFLGSGCSYFVSSFFAGRLLKVASVGALLAASTACVALSGADYSLARAWPFFAAGSILHGLGSGAIDAGLNHFVATHFSARHMTWLHACYSLGAMLGPLVMVGAIARAGSWRLGYAVVATALAGLAALFLATRRLWDDPGRAATGEGGDAPVEAVRAADALRHGMVRLHVLLFFLYTGLEVAIGQWTFTVLTEARGVPAGPAGIHVTLYWAGILAGRVGFGFIADRAGLDRVIRLGMVAALAGTALLAWAPDPRVAAPALVLAGLGLASIYPCLMTRTPQRLGKALAAHAIGFQVAAAMLGAAILPSLAGLLAEHAGLALVPAALAGLAATLLACHEAVLARAA